MPKVQTCQFLQRVSDASTRGFRPPPPLLLLLKDCEKREGRFFALPRKGRLPVQRKAPITVEVRCLLLQSEPSSNESQ